MDQMVGDWILETTEMAEGAIAMNRALLDADLQEARFRAKLLQFQAVASGDETLQDAAGLVVRLLGPPGSAPGWGCGAAMLAVSTRLGDRLAEHVA
ncbi:hypothetical protein [Xanthomonas sp. NCPPB 2632]|jgi:hypothetical protein|uniref:hypothetical protein n=1 Tax=Xanthomonas sp. NCPPB 2632 TaxID=3240912 RepID=UPI00351819A5